MRTEGAGGRGGGGLDDPTLLDGVRTRDETLPGWPRLCANERCRHRFTGYYEGDDYCSDLCERDGKE